MRKPLVVVVGPPKAGKTTVIRSLTGARGGSNPKKFDKNIVWANEGQDGVFVLGASPQERQGLNRKCVRDFLQMVMVRGDLRGAVIALQPREKPNAEYSKILNDATELGFRILAGVFQRAYGGAGIDVGPALDSLQRVKAELTTLDGTQFPDNNAAVLRKLSQLYK
jgi:hypothetical protein